MVAREFKSPAGPAYKPRARGRRIYIESARARRAAGQEQF